jgi:hypothetical protein
MQHTEYRMQHAVTCNVQPHAGACTTLTQRAHRHETLLHANNTSTRARLHEQIEPRNLRACERWLRACVSACAPAASCVQVVVKEESKAFYHFLTSVCAIIGGVFTVAVSTLSSHPSARQRMDAPLANAG